jgi:hypothetical protein
MLSLTALVHYHALAVNPLPVAISYFLVESYLIQLFSPQLQNVLFQELPDPHQVLPAPVRLTKEDFNFSYHKKKPLITRCHLRLDNPGLSSQDVNAQL